MGFELPFDPRKCSRCDRYLMFGRLRPLADVLRKAKVRQIQGRSVRRRPLHWVGWRPSHDTKTVYRNGHQARLRGELMIAAKRRRGALD